MTIDKGEKSLECVRKALSEQDLSQTHNVKIKMMQVMDDEESGVSDLAEIVDMDPSSSARLLKIAQSSYFAARGKIDDTKTAIVRIGFNNFREALMFSIAYDSVDSKDPFLVKLWENNIITAIGNKLLYEGEFGLNGYGAHSAGLLHDISISMAYQIFGDDGYKDAIAAIDDYYTDLVDVERDCFGITHEEIGAEIAKQWKFPPNIRHLMSNHHSMKTAGDRDFERLLHATRLSESMVVMLSQYIPNETFGYYHRNKSLFDQDLEESLKKLDINDASFFSLLDELKDEVVKLKKDNWFLDK